MTCYNTWAKNITLFFFSRDFQYEEVDAEQLQMILNDKILKGSAPVKNS